MFNRIEQWRRIAGPGCRFLTLAVIGSAVLRRAGDEAGDRDDPLGGPEPGGSRTTSQVASAFGAGLESRIVSPRPPSGEAEPLYSLRAA
jgi:hypothetical protein